jgi:hypothetical protein
LQTAVEAEAALKLWGVMEQRTSAQARELCEQVFTASLPGYFTGTKVQILTLCA